MATPQDNLDIVLAELRGADEHTRYVTVLTAYAESDFRSDVDQDGKTFGVFQQMPKYWETAMGTTAEQCRAFIADFA